MGADWIGLVGRWSQRSRAFCHRSDAIVASLYPNLLAAWQEPKSRALIILSALLAVSVLQTHTHLEWKFSHILFDYHFGLIKRGLVGEVFSWATPHVTIDQFFWVFAALNMVLIGLIAATLMALPRASAILLLVFLCLTPMLLRQVIYDWGRFDIFGLIAIWALALMLIRDVPGRIWVYALAPLTGFAHEVNLVIVCPFACVAILLFEPPSVLGKATALLAVGVSGISTGLLLVAHGHLDVPEALMLEHMAAKTRDPFETPMYILTTSLSENLTERYAFILDKALSAKFAVKLATVVLLFHWLLPDRLKRGRIAIGLALAILGFLPLYVFATDIFRWLGLQANVAFLLIVIAVAHDRIQRLPRSRLYLIGASVLVPVMGI